jgi:SRR1
MTHNCPPAPIPTGASLQTVLLRYRTREKTWRQTKAYTELKKTFISRIFKERFKITKCICFALSSPTTPDESDNAMYQLAAFKSVIDLLADRQRQPVEAFAQDPCFNTLDRGLLARLNITVVDHPAAFHHINPTTFVFCPYAEPFVIRGILDRSPAFYLANGEALKLYRDRATGQLHTRLRTCFPETAPRMGEASPAQIKARIRADVVKGATIVERFNKDKECVKLPVFAGHIRDPVQGVFDDMHLFWRSSNPPKPAERVKSGSIETAYMTASGDLVDPVDWNST